MGAPETVVTALSDRPTEGATCLEAGAGVGNGTVGLLDGGAEYVYAITNDRDHAKTVSERLTPEQCTRTAVLEGDLRALPLADDSVDIVLAHALFGVVPPAALPEIAAELTRVAAPDCHLVIDDYAPIDGESQLRRLFGVENAAAEITTGRPALVFYPAALLRRLFTSYGWSFDRTRSLLDPVPWSETLLDEHLDVIRRQSERLPDGLSSSLVETAERLAGDTGRTEMGTMYSIALRLPESGRTQ
ncbi:MAG: class I SAM-dependent methyltransferase [Halovenus sp.]